MNVRDHIEPDPPDPEGRPMMSYKGSVPCPVAGCGAYRRRLWGSGAGRRVICARCYVALWPVVGDAEAAREPNSGGQQNLL